MSEYHHCIFNLIDTLCHRKGTLFSQIMLAVMEKVHRLKYHFRKVLFLPNNH